MRTIPSILVVDDEPDILALVSYNLASRAYHVRAATDGVQALDCISAETPDLVVLDLMLPGMTGWEILRELRRRPGGSSLPVVLLSARREAEDQQMATHFGAADYITKPFSPRDLVHRIETVLQRVSTSVAGEVGTESVRLARPEAGGSCAAKSVAATAAD